MDACESGCPSFKTGIDWPLSDLLVHVLERWVEVNVVGEKISAGLLETLLLFLCGGALCSSVFCLNI